MKRYAEPIDFVAAKSGGGFFKKILAGGVFFSILAAVSFAVFSKKLHYREAREALLEKTDGEAVDCFSRFDFADNFESLNFDDSLGFGGFLSDCGDDVEVVVEAAQPTKFSEFNFARPLEGKILKDFSAGELVYSKTMDDWRTHDGVDIEASLGAPVKAAEAGVVEKVFDDDELGVTVIIKHSDEFSSIYSNLQDINFISPGKTVKKGDIIGGVGATSSLESLDAPHLHFSIVKNGEMQNPRELTKLIDSV
jgi:murein DD-endopeptidase MepM/ murein hydrolase activator NlpD